MAESTNTGGGPFVGRDANAGQDFVGRDKYSQGDGGSSSRVDIHTDSHRGDYSSAEILQNLQRAVLGDPYNPAQPGMLKGIAELTASMHSFHAWRAAADIELANLSRDIQAHHERTNQRLETTDSRITAIMALVWATVAIVGVEAVAIIWLFVQRSVAVMGG